MKMPFSSGVRKSGRWPGMTLLPVAGTEPEQKNGLAKVMFLTAGNHPVRCPLCLSTGQQTLFRYKNKGLNRCPACGGSYVVPQPSPKDVAAHFQNDHDAIQPHLIRDDLRRRFERNRERVLARVAKEIQRRRERGRILDVGCATGLFLARFFPASRWQAWAVELSERKARTAAQNGIRVHAGDIHQAKFEERSFDVVTVLDAFYYFPDPQWELKEFHRLLRNNGLLVLELPWAGSRIWRRSSVLRWLLRDGQVPLLESSDHLFYYTPESISLLLERCGFQVRAILPLPGNRQETIFRDLLCRWYSFFSALLHILSRSKCFLGPRFLVVAEKLPARPWSASSSPLLQT